MPTSLVRSCPLFSISASFGVRSSVLVVMVLADAALFGAADRP